MVNFRKKSTDQRCYEIQFEGEGSLDGGSSFRESLTKIVREMESGVVPLLLKSPNNRNEHGPNRDCFIFDCRHKSPTHKTMFKYLGAFLAFAFMSKSPMPFNLAPWFWKQLLEQEVTLADLEGIDAYSAQVLRDLEQFAQSLSAEDFALGVQQTFITVLSSGDEVPLCEGGAERRVTRENLAEFLALVLETRRQEAREQVAAVREGFLTAINHKTEILDFTSWSSLEVRCTGEKEVSAERLLSITIHPNIYENYEAV